MSSEFFCQLPCADGCNYGKECGTRLGLETPVCKNGMKMVCRQNKSEHPDLAFDYKSRVPNTTVVVSTDNREHVPMWIIRAQTWREWQVQAVYINGVLQKT